MCDVVYVEKYKDFIGDGLDIGRGCDKFNPRAIGIDICEDNIFDENDIQMNAENLEFPDESFDFVFSSHCLEDMEDTYSTLYEWTRVLKTGGKMVLVLPHADLYPNVGSGKENPSHKWDFKNEDILKILSDVCEYDLVESNVGNDRGNVSLEISIIKKAMKKKKEMSLIFEEFKDKQNKKITERIRERDKNKKNSIFVSIMCQEEKEDLRRLLKTIHDFEIIEKIFIVDGISYDGTYEMLREFPKTVLKIHPYMKGFHEMQSHQRNIQLSYIPFDRWVLILDPDEGVSEDLIPSLSNLKYLEKDIDFIQIPRRQESEDFDRETISDYQPRLIKNSESIKFWRSPHHLTVGFNKTLLSKDFGHIIHLEKLTENKRKEITLTWDKQVKGQIQNELEWYIDRKENILSRQNLKRK